MADALEKSTLRRLAKDVEGLRNTSPKGRFTLFLRLGPRGQVTKTELRWRAAAKRGLAVVEPFCNGVMVSLTARGKQYFGAGH